MLDLWKIDNEKILYVKLPGSILFDNGKYEVFGSSGMFEPGILTQLVFKQRYLTDSYKKYHICQWKRLLKENAEMRISLNKQLLSVNANFYDAVIISEIDKLGDTFEEATAVGNSLTKLWTSDSFVAWRIDVMIENGLYEVVEKAKKGSPCYYRLLKKI